MRGRAAVAFVVCALAACTFGDLDSFDHGARDAGAPIDANTSKADPDSSVENATDGDVTDAAADDADASVAVEASVDAATGCNANNTLLLGNKTNPTSGAQDSTGGGYVDSFGFVVTKTATAQCAFVYLDPGSSSDKPIYVGVYSSTMGDAGVPSALLATATFNGATSGWNGATLDHPVVLTPGDHLWLAIGGPTAVVNYRYYNATCDGLNDHAGTTAPNGLANPFAPSAAYPGTCQCLAYLTQ